MTNPTGAHTDRRSHLRKTPSHFAIATVNADLYPCHPPCTLGRQGNSAGAALPTEGYDGRFQGRDWRVFVSVYGGLSQAHWQGSGQGTEGRGSLAGRASAFAAGAAAAYQRGQAPHERTEAGRVHAGAPVLTLTGGASRGARPPRARPGNAWPQWQRPKARAAQDARQQTKGIGAGRGAVSFSEASRAQELGGAL